MSVIGGLLTDSGFFFLFSGVCIMASKPHPPLMKKHSQTDLISRLKSRKILGVGGEDDDGEVHRSKVRWQHVMFYSFKVWVVVVVVFFFQDPFARQMLMWSFIRQERHLNGNTLVETEELWIAVKSHIGLLIGTSLLWRSHCALLVHRIWSAHSHAFVQLRWDLHDTSGRCAASYSSFFKHCLTISYHSYEG